MTREQQLLLDAAEMLIEANNRFAQYYQLVLPTFPNTSGPGIPMCQPEEYVVMQLEDTRDEMIKAGRKINLHLEPVFKRFIESKVL